MKFFIDTANVNDIRKANDMGVICGVTTNPSLIAKEGRDFNEVIKEITSIVDGPISGEVKATTVDAEGMIKEGAGEIIERTLWGIGSTVAGTATVGKAAKGGLFSKLGRLFGISANKIRYWLFTKNKDIDYLLTHIVHKGGGVE